MREEPQRSAKNAHLCATPLDRPQDRRENVAPAITRRSCRGNDQAACRANRHGNHLRILTAFRVAVVFPEGSGICNCPSRVLTVRGQQRPFAELPPSIVRLALSFESNGPGRGSLASAWKAISAGPAGGLIEEPPADYPGSPFPPRGMLCQPPWNAPP